MSRRRSIVGRDLLPFESAFISWRCSGFGIDGRQSTKRRLNNLLWQMWQPELSKEYFSSYDMRVMGSGKDRQYWTLSEAAAWVVFRSDVVVQKFSPPNPSDFPAFMAFPTMRRGHPEVGKVSELFKALRAGQLRALARRNLPGGTVEEIPVAEWSDLEARVRGPYRHIDGGGKDYPWIEFQVRRADVERLWRRSSEKQARTRFEWDRLKALWLDLEKHNSDLSQNELIIELQGAYRDETGKEPPSRSSIQRQMRNW